MLESQDMVLILETWLIEVPCTHEVLSCLCDIALVQASSTFLISYYQVTDNLCLTL